jgi:hypothetical protein
VIRDGKLVVDIPDGFAPNGTKVLLAVIDMSNLCRAVFVPGVLRPPGEPPKPRVRTRCALPAGHDGDHSFI